MNQPARLGAEEFARINPITDRIIGCAIEVHRTIGPGLFESIYRSALAIEFAAAGLQFVKEARVSATYKGRVLGTFRLDFLVEDMVVVEIKSVERMDPVFEAQLMTYMRLTNQRVGLLINFNSRLVKEGIKRRIL
ncbi:MAG TPA: GxxExxY protein [Vicinamibacterales bacterium]|nr:GxxExxY protein [Vicinamibacterales bacterium]